ncbi:hypothetical protein CF319_g5285 [Tilletia indica]|nr:hypothetical protein CF319_g5285 [Tilletia indica]
MDANEAKVVTGVNLINSGLTLRYAAKLSGASKETIRRGAAAKAALWLAASSEFHGPQRRLKHEEAALVDFIMQMEASGCPLRQFDIEASAMAFLAARWDDSTSPLSLGDRWFSQFIDCQSKLSFRTKETLSRQRTKGLSEANAEHFFSILRSTGALFADASFHLLTVCNKLSEVARAKALTAANITASYASTGIWPLTGTKAIPESMFTPAALSEAEMEEAEREAFVSSTLAEALYDLVPQMRSARAKDAVLTASRRI